VPTREIILVRTDVVKTDFRSFRAGQRRKVATELSSRNWPLEFCPPELKFRLHNAATLSRFAETGH